MRWEAEDTSRPLYRTDRYMTVDDVDTRPELDAATEFRMLTPTPHDGMEQHSARPYPQDDYPIEGAPSFHSAVTQRVDPSSDTLYLTQRYYVAGGRRDHRPPARQPLPTVEDIERSRVDAGERGLGHYVTTASARPTRTPPATTLASQPWSDSWASRPDPLVRRPSDADVGDDYYFAEY